MHLELETIISYSGSGILSVPIRIKGRTKLLQIHVKSGEIDFEDDDIKVVRNVVQDPNHERIQKFAQYLIQMVGLKRTQDLLYCQVQLPAEQYVVIILPDEDQSECLLMLWDKEKWLELPYFYNKIKGKFLIYQDRVNVKLDESTLKELIRSDSIEILDVQIQNTFKKNLIDDLIASFQETVNFPIIQSLSPAPQQIILPTIGGSYATISMPKILPTASPPSVNLPTVACSPSSDSSSQF